MEYGNGHIELEELASLLEFDSVDSSRLLNFPPDKQRHFAECERCRALAETFEKSGVNLRALRETHSMDRTSICPEEHLLRELACGVLKTEVATELIRHVIGCSHCGFEYRQVADELADNSKEDELVISSLDTSKIGTQRQLANSLAQKSSEQSSAGSVARKFWRRRVLVPISLAASILACVGYLWVSRRGEDVNPNTLLAKAYAEQRTFDLRFQEAPFAQIHRERGTASSVLAKSEPLLQAEFSIKQQLKKAPNDPVLLDARGKAELLEWQYDDAINSLSMALKERPQWPEALSDLAIAYTQRGDQENRPFDYGKAIDLLGQGLTLEPKNGVLIFNRAIVEEKLNLLEVAKSDWLLFLQIDPRSQWAQEAHKHLRDIQQKLDKSKSGAAAKNDPSVAVADLSQMLRSSEQYQYLRDSRDEDYLEIAVREWIPAMAKRKLHGSPINESTEWRALSDLAAIMAIRHRDDWLLDVLSGPFSDQVAQGWIQLGLAASANAEGDFTSAGDFASKAESSLRDASEAAFLLAVWEHAYAMQRSQRGSSCFSDTFERTHRLKSHKYPWLSAQLLFERAICAGMLADMDQPKRLIARAMVMAESEGYSTLMLRAYHLRGIQSASQDPNEAWNWFMKGLIQHWAGPYRPFRVYQFYAEMAITAENRGEWHLAETLMTESVMHIRRTENRLTTAIAIRMLGTTTEMAGQSQQAMESLREAENLFASIPPSLAVNDLRASIEVEQASILCQEGQCSSALKVLESAEPYLTSQSQYRIWLEYYGALGEALLETGNVQKAQGALNAAIEVSERALSSIRDENNRIQWEKSTERPYRELVELEFEAKHDPERALDIWSWYTAASIRSPNTRAEERVDFSKYATHPFAAPQILTQIVRARANNVTFVSFADLGNEIVAWEYDERGVSAIRLAVSPLELRTTAASFDDLCSDPNSDVKNLQSAGAQLYQWLIAPLEPHLSANRTLAIDSDGPVRNVSFAALVTPRGTYLGQEFALVVSAGVDSWVPLRVPGTLKRQDRVLAIASPFGSEGRPFLPETYAEVAEVTEHFADARVLVGREATLKAIKREMAGVRVFHFAGHSIANDTTSGLILAESKRGSADPPNEEQFMGATQIQNLPLRTVDLVVLSACSSEGKYSLDNSPYPLVTPFLRAGVPHVIATRWAVDSTTTVAFMKELYNALLKNGEPASALRFAYSLALKDPRTAHPYYWAGFSAFGR